MIPGLTTRRRFSDLSEQEILALAISSEEDDSRIYRSYGERLPPLADKPRLLQRITWLYRRWRFAPLNPRQQRRYLRQLRRRLRQLTG